MMDAGRDEMAAAPVFVPVEEYLRSSYSPDAELLELEKIGSRRHRASSGNRPWNGWTRFHQTLLNSIPRFPICQEAGTF
jgi:hypothetical protein